MLSIRTLPLFCILLCGCGLSGADNSQTSQDVNAHTIQAQTFIDAGQYESAIELLQPLADKKIKNDNVYALLARSQWKSGLIDDAGRNFETSLRLFYEAPHVHLDFATMLMEAGRVGRALTEFELAVRFAGRDPLPHYNYGLALYEQDRVEDALGYWERAHMLDPTNAKYAEAMGIGLSGLDDRKALRYFRIAADLGADAASFHNNYGLLLNRLRDFGGAQLEFGRAHELDPGSTAFRSNLATAFMRAKQFSNAIPHWRVLLASSPDDRRYHTYLARALYEEGEFAEAIEQLEGWLLRQRTGGGPEPPSSWSKFDRQTEVVGPGLNEAFDVLAMSHRGLGDFGKATKFILRAIEIAPKNIVHLNNYGVILAEDGKIDDARAQWEKVLELEPNDPTAKQNLSATRR